MLYIYIYLYYDCLYIYIYTIHLHSKLDSRGSFPDPKRGPSCLKKCGLPQVGTVTLSSLERQGKPGKRAGILWWNFHGFSMPYCQWVIDSIQLPRLCNRNSPGNAAWAFEVLLKCDMGRYMGYFFSTGYT